MQKNKIVSGDRRDLAISGCAIRFNSQSALEITYEESVLNSKEISALQSGSIKYGLYQRDHIPFLLIEIADVQLDFPINVYDLSPSLQRYRLHNFQGEAVYKIFLQTTRQVVVKRKLRFSPHFTVHLKSCFQRQLKYYHSESEVIRRVNELLEFLGTKQMFKESTLYKII